MPPLVLISHSGELLTGEPPKQPQAEQIDKPSPIEELFKLAEEEARRTSTNNQRGRTEP
jgi:hypothetical protein